MLKRLARKHKLTPQIVDTNEDKSVGSIMSAGFKLPILARIPSIVDGRSSKLVQLITTKSTMLWLA